jgi:Tannase-like family of unknown function (DUF6351)
VNDKGKESSMITKFRFLAVLATVAMAFANPAAHAQSATTLTVEVLSSRPELVSGGDALVKISGAARAPAVTVDGKDVSGAFRPDSKGGFIGLVDGLKDGDNRLLAKDGQHEATLTLKNHPRNATLFAGPQQTPFLCENESHGLASAKDESCAAPSTVKYFYRNRAGEWKPFDAKAPRPSDIGMTTTTEGKQVPLIVRQEKGVINRSAYLINILHDPAAGPLPTPTQSSPASGWNGKVIYSFGPGVQSNYHMGRGLGMMAGTDGKFYMEDLGVGYRDSFITRGYAILAGSLNVFGTNSDDVKSAETAAKIKEHFIKQFGRPLFAIGHGASGGSMQQQMIANAYPGLLDGIMPARLFADTMTFLQPLYDCELLQNVFKSGGYSREQMNAVSGKYWGYCVSNGTRYPNARVDGCDATVKDMVANEESWKRVRCTYQDNLVNVFGIDPKTGFARNPFDNVGVQYGLQALNDGKISFDHFIDINTRVGGLDINGKVMSQRMRGDPEALKRAYEIGRVMAGTGGAAAVPYVDIRTYNDGDPLGRGDANVDVHDGYHSAVVRARLLKYNGTAANHVMLTAATYGSPPLDARTERSPLNVVSTDALAQIDKWLTAIAADTSNKSPAQKVADNRPKDFVDACYPTKAGPLIGAIEKVTDMERCKALFPFSGDARLAAGAPATDDVFKCTLKPIAAADYKVAPNAEQVAQLQKVFPEGVCDYSKPGVGQTTKVVTWADFTKGNGEFTALAPPR